MDVKKEYERRIHILQAIASEIYTILKENFQNKSRIDLISTRVKSVHSFLQDFCIM
jgi:hypothetical protein